MLQGSTWLHRWALGEPESGLENMHIKEVEHMEGHCVDLWGYAIYMYQSSAVYWACLLPDPFVHRKASHPADPASIPPLLCRAPSPSGLMSPSRLPGSRERDWENGSNASSPASVPEYTGKCELREAIGFPPAFPQPPPSPADCLPSRSPAVQRTQRQVQQVYHPQCLVTLLPSRQGERAPEEPNFRGELFTCLGV